MKQIVWKTKAYTLFTDSVKQGKFVAKALSNTEMVSNYQSEVNNNPSSIIEFKFSINGKDNEMLPGINHHFNCSKNNNQTPIISFGKPSQVSSNTKNSTLLPNAKLTVRLDMRPILTDFTTKGFYTTYNGNKIYAADFKGVFIAGGTAPMFWDFDNLPNRHELQLHDLDGDGIYETTLTLNAQKDKKQTDAGWKLTKDIVAFPRYRSNYRIANAIYNLSLEEMVKAIEADSTFRTGKEWAGVWTRDISYSIILSMAYLQPQVAMKSLLKKVNAKKRIIQDTGTGGAYPVSTDRMVWAIAAWEVYLATCDKLWLEEAYAIVKNSIEDDLQNAYDIKTGLVRGESSFLDWREQTYPKWMQPADIFESVSLGTNAVHYQANQVLAKMATALNQKMVAEKHEQIASNIKKGINKYLWMPQKGYYAQYLYGRNFKIQSPRSEALGEALCVLFGIANPQQQAAIINHTPVTAFGISCIYPHIPDIPAYHNNAVWPFVQAYWALASAKTGNDQAVTESFAAIYRAAALFLTNKENLVADNGDFAGTVINSSNMLWSLSGNIALIHKVLFGIQFLPNGLTFHPFIPQAFTGTHTLSYFKYRNSILNITVSGVGNVVKTIMLDGKPLANNQVHDSTTGTHEISIVLVAHKIEPKINSIYKVGNYTSLTTPVVDYKNGKLEWQKVAGAVSYQIIKNGAIIDNAVSTHWNDVKETAYAEYQVIALDAQQIPSFASEPVMIVAPQFTQTIQMEQFATKANFPFAGFTGNGFIEINNNTNTTISIPINVAETGLYAIDFRYANGSGPINTENKCAIRTLQMNNQFAGTIVFPQRGKEEWSNWGFSNAIQIPLQKGQNMLILSFEPANENMNGAINRALLDYVRVRRL